MSRWKWVVLGVGLSAVLGLALWSSGGAEVVVAPPAPPPAPGVVPARPPPPPEREEFDSPPDPPAPAIQAPPAVLTPRRPRLPINPEALARETELLDRARREVKSDAELALKILSEHERRFREPALEKDAQLIRIEALLRLSRRPEAEALGQMLTTSDPAAKKAVDRLFERVRPR